MVGIGKNSENSVVAGTQGAGFKIMVDKHGKVH